MRTRSKAAIYVIVALFVVSFCNSLAEALITPPENLAPMPTDLFQTSPPTIPADGPCEGICTEPSCTSLPVDLLPAIEITETLIIYPDNLCLCDAQGGGKQVEGEGEVFLPNMQAPDDAAGIHASFVLEWPSLQPICVIFGGQWPDGIPIGTSGFVLTSLEGEVLFDPEPVLQMAGTIESRQQIPCPPDMELSPALIAKGDLEGSLQAPYVMTMTGTIEMLCGILGGDATASLDQSWGLAGQMTLTSSVCEDAVGYVHVWQEADGSYGFTGSTSLQCVLEKGSFNPLSWPAILPDIPSNDITITAESEIGELCWKCEGGVCNESSYGICGCTTLDIPLPDIVEPGAIALRFCLSESGIVSPTTNLVKCSDLGAAGTRAWCLDPPPSIRVTQPDTPDETAGGSYTIRWQAEDPDGDAAVSLYYDRDAQGRDGRLIARCLDPQTGQYVWDTSGVPAGAYYVYARIDDGVNCPVVSYSAGTVEVSDTTMPLVPLSVTVQLEGSLPTLTWAPNTEEDVVGYRIYYGPEPGNYTKSYDATNVSSFRLPVKALPESGCYAVTAYDSAGNESTPSGPICIWFAHLPVVQKRTTP